jgi:hypothetical protein
MRTRIFVLLLVGFTLAVPASAAAHAPTATVALDYRLDLDRATRSIPGLAVAILVVSVLSATASRTLLAVALFAGAAAAATSVVREERA